MVDTVLTGGQGSGGVDGVSFGAGAVGSVVSTAAAPVIGGVIDYWSQNNANESNERIAAGNIAFQREMWDKGSAFNSAQAALNRQWQEDMYHKSERYNTEMSNTQFQRGIADLEAAGLNKMLAYTKGGASSPQMSAPSGSSASSPGTPSGAMIPKVAPKIGDAIKSGITSALEYARLKKDIDATDSQIRVNRELEQTQRTQQQLNQSAARKQDVEAANMSLQKNAIAKEAKAREGQAELDQLKQDLQRGTITYDHYAERVAEILAGLRDIAITGVAGKSLLKMPESKVPSMRGEPGYYQENNLPLKQSWKF